MIRKVAAVAAMAVLGGMPWAAAQEEPATKECLKVQVEKLEGQLQDMMVMVEGQQVACLFNMLAFDELGGSACVSLSMTGEGNAAVSGNRKYVRVVGGPGTDPKDFEKCDKEFEKVLEALKDVMKELPQE